jgi:hypothetical protein
MLVLVLAVAFSLGCSGKTTVREEMIDTSPRQGSDEKKETVKESDEAKEEASKEEPKEESKEQPSSQLPSPGIGGGPGGGQAPTPMTPGDGRDKTEREGGKEARESYYQQNLVYPGSEPLPGPGLPDPPGFTGRSILSKDPADKVASWYANKFGEKASMNKMGMGKGEQYRVIINDKDSGYSTDILIHQIDSNNPTRILISLRDAE